MQERDAAVRPADPYSCPRTGVLINIHDIEDGDELDRFECMLAGTAMENLLRRDLPRRFDAAHLKAVHFVLFGEIYAFAGRYRTVEIWKPEPALSGRSVAYAKPDDIEAMVTSAIQSMKSAISEDGVSWKRMAPAAASLWRAHPFREGNTRAVAVFLQQFARACDAALDPEAVSATPGELRDAFALAADGVPDRLESLLRNAAHSEARRNHPVFGRVTPSAAALLEPFAAAPAGLALPGDRVRGQVLCETEGTVLVLTARGVIGVDFASFDVDPEPQSRVDVIAASARHDMDGGFVPRL